MLVRLASKYPILSCKENQVAHKVKKGMGADTPDSLSSTHTLIPMEQIVRGYLMLAHLDMAIGDCFGRLGIPSYRGPKS